MATSEEVAEILRHNRILLGYNPDPPSKCSGCGSYQLCAADCVWAPWNEDKAPTTRFGHMMRQRRWVKSGPVPREALRFVSWPHR